MALTETGRTGSCIISLANGNQSKENVTLLSGQDLAANTVLGKVTGSGLGTTRGGLAKAHFGQREADLSAGEEPFKVLLVRLVEAEGIGDGAPGKDALVDFLAAFDRSGVLLGGDFATEAVGNDIADVGFSQNFFRRFAGGHIVGVEHMKDVAATVKVTDGRYVLRPRLAELGATWCRYGALALHDIDFPEFFLLHHAN